MKWTREQWEEEGRKALLDLIAAKAAVPWGEAIARISNAGWNGFRHVQPLQLEGARKGLLAEGGIVQDATRHLHPIRTYRLAETGLREDALERERGRRRGLYRTFVRWTGDQAACGHHAEKVVYASMKRAAGEGRYVVPNQRAGHVPGVLGVEISRGPLDGLAVLHDLRTWEEPVAMVLEVKNVHDWIYPWDRRLWELLVKAADLAEHMSVFPVLVCPHSDMQCFRMGIDVGFSRARYEVQLFASDEDKISLDEFLTVVNEFDLTALRYPATKPHPQLVKFFQEEPRRDIHTVQGGGHRAWYAMAAERFRALAPTVLRLEALAGDVEQPERGHIHRAFQAAAREGATWPWGGGWGYPRNSGAAT